MNKKSQCKAILDFIDQYGSITVRDIQSELKFNGATARISDLRSAGYNIMDYRKKNPNGGTPYKVFFRGPDEFNSYLMKGEIKA